LLADGVGVNPESPMAQRSTLFVEPAGFLLVRLHQATPFGEAGPVDDGQHGGAVDLELLGQLTDRRTPSYWVRSSRTSSG
jgi:hypothetical protein